MNKFERLHHNRTGAARGRLANTVHNLSLHDPSIAELAVLALVTSTLVQRKMQGSLFAQGKTFSQIDPSYYNEASARVIGLLSVFHLMQFSSPLSAYKHQAIRSLCKNRNLVILPADKGNATVLLDHDDYVNRTESLLDDANNRKKILAEVFICFLLEHKFLYFLLLCHNGVAPAL